jgi:3-phenylpropionate/cinnamic acid dioxygenase small subunit
MGDVVQAISNIVFRYAELVDQGDFDGAGALFTHARFRAITPAGIRTVEGADAITHQLSSTVRRYGDGTPRTRHITTNLIVEAGDAPDTMTCRSYFTVLQAIEGFHLVPVIAGRYQDTFQLRDGVWWFADRLVMPDLIGDLSHHLYVSPFGD